MHGLINRSIQCFLRDTYGPAIWSQVAQKAGLAVDSFEALLIYDIALTDAVIGAAVQVLRRPRDTILEDLGTYLVAHPNTESLRRLLRFGGGSFVDFLHSLDDLPDRGHLALPDLDLPKLRLVARGDGVFNLHASGMIHGVGHVIVGLLRTMADDYGALVLLDHAGAALPVQTTNAPVEEVISIQLLDQSYSAGRHFDLALPGH